VPVRNAWHRGRTGLAPDLVSPEIQKSHRELQSITRGRLIKEQSSAKFSRANGCLTRKGSVNKLYRAHAPKAAGLCAGRRSGDGAARAAETERVRCRLPSWLNEPGRREHCGRFRGFWGIESLFWG
jgi:hypothetical protein